MSADEAAKCPLLAHPDEKPASDEWAAGLSHFKCSISTSLYGADRSGASDVCLDHAAGDLPRASSAAPSRGEVGVGPAATRSRLTSLNGLALGS